MDRQASAEEFLGRYLGELSRHFSFKGGALALLNERDELVIVAAFGTIDDAARRVRLRKGEGIAGSVAATGRTVYVPDLDRPAPLAPAARDVGTNRLIRSYLCAPIATGLVVVGVVEVDSDHPRAFQAEDVARFERAASAMGSDQALAGLRAAVLGRDPGVPP